MANKRRNLCCIRVISEVTFSAVGKKGLDLSNLSFKTRPIIKLGPTALQAERRLEDI